MCVCVFVTTWSYMYVSPVQVQPHGITCTCHLCKYNRMVSHVNTWTCYLCRYNPEHGAESRLLRHRAAALQDMAHSFLDHELSEDFEKVG